MKKTGLRGFGPGPTQTGLYSHRRWLDLFLQKRKIHSKTERRAQAIFNQNERQRLHALATSNP